MALLMNLAEFGKPAAAFKTTARRARKPTLSGV